jgi:carboxyl-terminal processing protease
MTKNRLTVFLPLLLSLAFILGMMLARYLPENNKTIEFKGSDYNQKLQSILHYINDEYVDSIDMNQLVEESLPYILENLDPHSVYIPASLLSEVSEPLEGEFEGIGIEFNIQNDTIVVVNTIAGGPSATEGVMPGDRIVYIDDTLVAGKNVTSEEVMKKLKGTRGTKVIISVLRKTSPKLIDIEITRGRIPLHSVDVAYMANKTTGYIKVSKFAKNTHKEFVYATEQLLDKGMKSIVVDLRGNSGGYLDAATALADEFLVKGKLIVYTEGKNRPRVSSYATRKGTCQDIKVAVLIDEWSASASEIFAGAIQDNDRGIIIGRRSFGKGLVQEPTFFPDGSSLRLTVARYYTPTGRCIQKPYNKGKDEYYEDMYNSLLGNETLVIDSSKKYITPGGKVLYGGGGIQPDIVVPPDTLGLTPFFYEVVNKNLIYRFAWKYTDANRVKLKTFSGWLSLVNYIDKQGVYKELLKYISENDVKVPASVESHTEKILKTHLSAYISRNLFDDAGFYPIALSVDATFLRSLEVLK